MKREMTLRPGPEVPTCYPPCRRTARVEGFSGVVVILMVVAGIAFGYIFGLIQQAAQMESRAEPGIHAAGER